MPIRIKTSHHMFDRCRSVANGRVPCSILRRAVARRSDGVPRTRGPAMDDDASPEPDPGSYAVPATESVPAETSFHADDHHLAPRVEWRLRRLAGRKAAYRGPIVACTRGWVSRDTRWHVFAARFLDFALLTPEHLVLCSTGFFTRRPRRQVLREPLGRLVVTTIGPAPVRAVRIVGDFSRPIRIELRDRP